MHRSIRGWSGCWVEVHPLESASFMSVAGDFPLRRPSLCEDNRFDHRMQWGGLLRQTLPQTDFHSVGESLKRFVIAGTYLREGRGQCRHKDGAEE